MNILGGWAFRIPIERVTSGVAVCDTNHGQVHAGNAYTFSKEISLGNGASVYFACRVPSTAYVHLQNLIASFNQEFKLEFIEYDNNDGSPTPLSSINRHRGRANTSVVVIGEDEGEGTGTPLTLLTSVFAAGRGVTGLAEDNIEWVLKGGYTYVLKITNQTATAGTGSIKIDWYEETGS